MINGEANSTSTHLILDCDPSIGVEEILKKFADQESKCKVRTAKAALAMVESGAAKSEREAAKIISEETGDKKETVRKRINRGKEAMGTSVPKKKETDEKKQVFEKGELPQEQKSADNPRDKSGKNQGKNGASNPEPSGKKIPKPGCIEPPPQCPETASGTVDEIVDDPKEQAKASNDRTGKKAESHGEVLKKMAIDLDTIKNAVENKGVVPEDITEGMLQDIKFQSEHLRTTIEGIAKWNNVTWR
jgi:hypothetical protein